jgi:FAD/FMN-containing dehydrogenase
VGFGSADAHAALVAPLRKALPPLFELVTPMPYVALQQLFNDSAPWGLRGYEKALYLDELSDGAIATIAEHAPKKQFPLSFCPTFALDGAYGAVADDATAFGGIRSGGFMFNIAGHAMTPEVYAAEREWVRPFWEAMRPHARGSGSYVNFMTEADEDRVRATYGAAKYARLARIKAAYDRDNVFHRNANIKPAASA